MLVDSAVEVVPLCPDGHIGFVDAPGGTDRSGEPLPAFFNLRDVATHPSENRRVRNDDPSLRHHFHQISVREPVGDIPADTECDDVGVEMASAVDGISGDRLRHSVSVVGWVGWTAPSIRRHQNC